MRTQWMDCVYVGLAGLLLLPIAASAQQVAYTNGPANMRAGPAQDYPLVAQLPPGSAVTVMGCVAGYSWCDVAMPNLRGWVYAGRLGYPYQGANVPILSYGVTLGLPIVAFSIGSYWGNYYRGRPWFGTQGRWANHAPPRPGPMRPPMNRPAQAAMARPPMGARPQGPGPGGRPPGNMGGRPPGNMGARPAEHGAAPGGQAGGGKGERHEN